jgi:hypothetical protein
MMAGDAKLGAWVDWNSLRPTLLYTQLSGKVSS